MLSLLLLISVNTGYSQIDSVDINQLITEAKNLRMEVIDINTRMHDYANLNNGAFILTLIGVGTMILTSVDGNTSDDEVLFYTGAGLTTAGTFMLYFNSNKLKKKSNFGYPSYPAHVQRRLARQK